MDEGICRPAHDTQADGRCRLGRTPHLNVLRVRGEEVGLNLPCLCHRQSAVDVRLTAVHHACMPGQTVTHIAGIVNIFLDPRDLYLVFGALK